VHYVSLLPTGCICEMASRVTISVPSFSVVGSGIQVILRSLPQQFERLSVGISLSLSLSHTHTHTHTHSPTHTHTHPHTHTLTHSHARTHARTHTHAHTHTHTHTERKQGNLISLLVFFQNYENWLQLTIIATHFSNTIKPITNASDISNTRKNCNKSFWLFQNFQL
jgi:hypothetical protein